eukprot:13506843-Alexandrium_andersonii.AAC.2
MGVVGEALGWALRRGLASRPRNTATAANFPMPQLSIVAFAVAIHRQLRRPSPALRPWGRGPRQAQQSRNSAGRARDALGVGARARKRQRGGRPLRRQGLSDAPSDFGVRQAEEHVRPGAPGNGPLGA